MTNLEPDTSEARPNDEQWKRLLDVAARLFAQRGPAVSMDAIAEEAGVGIGMLARHFPTREALISAVQNRPETPNEKAIEKGQGDTRMTARRTLFVVTMEPSDGFEDKLNRWYDEEHFPERLSIPGFLSGRRLKSDAPGPSKYLALYDLADPGVLDSAPYHQLSTPPSPWTREVRQNVKITREVYLDITPDLPSEIPVRRDADEL